MINPFSIIPFLVMILMVFTSWNAARYQYRVRDYKYAMVWAFNFGFCLALTLAAIIFILFIKVGILQ